MWKEYNPNPSEARVGDCTVRAISKALNQGWEDTYLGLAMEGLAHCDMPSANNVWGAYLKKRGYTRHIVPDSCPECYTVRDFCEDNPKGTYILALNGHVVTAIDGNYYDTWDSGGEVPVYFWKENEE